MEKKDILLKEYPGDSAHFCDFINGVLFYGEHILSRGQVQDWPTELTFTKEISRKNDSGKNILEFKTIHRFRDLTKKCVIGKDEVLIAIQNQSTIDNNMVLSVVFYHGGELWNSQTESDKMICVPSQMEKFRQYILRSRLLMIIMNQEEDKEEDREDDVAGEKDLIIVFSR